MDNTFSFKYKNDQILNIISFLCFIILSVIIIILFKSNLNIPIKIIYLLLSFIIINIFLFIIHNKVCIRLGKFTLNQKQLIYENFSTEYALSYEEIEYISIEKYVDDSNFYKYENYLYKIKIKNSGSFVFKYYDDSLITAIKALSVKTKIKIDEFI